MDKKALIIHRVLVGLCLFCFVWEFVFYLANWSSLPEEPGIHFGPDGTFDVYASKIFGFYPHVISLIVLAVHFFVSFVISREKLQLGVNITEKGKRMFLGSLMITVDLVVLSVLLCFCCWVFAVSAQNENIMGLTPNIIFSAGLMIAFCAVIFQCIVCAVYSEKPETEEEFSPAEKRKRLGMTQIEFAEKMHVTRQTVSRWEAGTVMPDVEKIGEIADILGVSCDYLLKDGASEDGAVRTKGVGKLLQSILGKTVQLVFYDEEADIDLFNTPCRVASFEGNWMQVTADTKKGRIEKLIPVSSVLSIEIVKEDH